MIIIRRESHKNPKWQPDPETLPRCSLLFPPTGTGTFGRVVLVQDRKTKGYFALKSMKIVDLIRLKQQQHVHNEKEVLMDVTHPFIVKL